MSNIGVWKEVQGVFTPGGDPAWECPFCGKGQHVYGIETSEYYSNQCSNCKATLRYPWENKDTQ